MVKIVRVFLALFATLWYTTSPINSNSTSQVWVTPVSKMTVETPDYYIYSIAFKQVDEKFNI